MEKAQVKENNTITTIAKGIGISLLITVIALTIFSIILTYTNI